MPDLPQIMPVTKVKRGLLDILKVMQEENSTITLTRNGEAVGVIMPERGWKGNWLATARFGPKGFGSSTCIEEETETLELHYVGHRRDVYELLGECAAIGR